MKIFGSSHLLNQSGGIGTAVIIHYAEIHILDFKVAAFYRAGIVPLLVVELCIVILTAGVCKLAYQLYQSLPDSAVQKKNTTEWAYAKQSYKKDTNRENKQEE